ncbi:threonine synthase [Salinispira pacifica]|uniref:Threonine synthase n=1 Tax=Salinispira pacifica TaxID=1307761 RepID=V5WDA0_9SPIO|nr:threonine synthase [Salinispira pacifica]AHC13519.1 Threonine synthase [Salinispira pacifica]
MKFASTRNQNTEVSFEHAVFQGLAPDGGLYHPVEHADLSELFQAFDAATPFTEIASRITSALFPGEIPPADAQRIAESAFPFSPGLIDIEDSISLLELYHGPSCAFKDFGASYLATVMEYFLKGKSRRAVILTATSGDTGSAVAQAFYGREQIDVVILYPSGRVSPSQEKQLTTLGGNIHALEIEGSFDDCQRMVKEAFTDPVLQKELPLTSANSINLGRLIPQSFYYVYAYARMRERLEGKLYFTVPSGNFGNLTAGAFAWRWGLPVDRFIAATNLNDVVPEYLQTGVFKPRASLHTYANAMDVGNPSNFERLQALFRDGHGEMDRMVRGLAVDDGEILSTMKRFHDDKEIFLCPHSATGILASERFLKEQGTEPGHVISLGTAHPAKFSEVSRKACGEEPPMPSRLAESLKKEKKADVLGNTLEELSGYLRSKLV